MIENINYFDKIKKINNNSLSKIKNNSSDIINSKDDCNQVKAITTNPKMKLEKNKIFYFKKDKNNFKYLTKRFNKKKIIYL